ncbi:14 kDa zinc-binding protein isoform X2 [Magnolia sinica]|uniref:14 kDa zinc-binding protein isoform X2 n=1 Tax=Magnolia sinica TaxID=86752 RepID=UPI0026595A1B|nr:14 kDa zinc-binding protein isoform X2 [Magnolia sinica]
MISFPFSASKSMAAAAANPFLLLRHSHALRALTTAKTSLGFPNSHCRIPILPLLHSNRFDKIIAKEIPSTIVYEDEKVLAFRDISPQAPVHVLVIPKFRDGLTQLSKAEPRHAEILGHLLYAAKIVAEKEGIQDGFRVVINNGPDACQSVYHLHLHILGKRPMKWPPG